MKNSRMFLMVLLTVGFTTSMILPMHSTLVKIAKQPMTISSRVIVAQSLSHLIDKDNVNQKVTEGSKDASKIPMMAVMAVSSATGPASGHLVLFNVVNSDVFIPAFSVALDNGMIIQPKGEDPIIIDNDGKIIDSDKQVNFHAALYRDMAELQRDINARRTREIESYAIFF